MTRGSMHEIVNRARELAEAGFGPSGRWSFGEICEHLARAIELSTVVPAPEIAARVARQRAGRSRLRIGFWRFVVLRLGWVPRGVPAPNAVRPPAEVGRAAALAHLDAAATRFEAHFADPNAQWAEHPLLGPFSARQWRRFHHVHAAHHLGFLVPGSQIRRTRGTNAVTSIEALEQKELFG